MNRVFIYWDNSNIFHEAHRLAEERREGANARYHVRVNFDNILRLAHADRPLKKALAIGSVPPEMRQLLRESLPSTRSWIADLISFAFGIPIEPQNCVGEQHRLHYGFRSSLT